MLRFIYGAVLNNGVNDLENKMKNRTKGKKDFNKGQQHGQYRKQDQGGVKMELKQTFPLTIKRLGINGEGVGYFKRQVVFVPGALPGEEVVAEVTKVHPKFSEARIKKVRKPSEHRVNPVCPVYEECGGCQLQHLHYSEQLKEKRDIIIQSLERHSKLPISDLKIHETIGMENPWGYRNKSQFQVGEKEGKVLAGLYGMNSHKLINIEQCAVQHPATVKATIVRISPLPDFSL